MKVGIFADSYGVSGVRQPKLNIGISWVKLLEYTVDVTNYSVAGSSLYYSYQNFLNHKDKHDKNIVLGSWNGRMYVPDMPWHHIDPHILDASHIWKNRHKFSDEQINASINYYKYIYNYTFDCDMRCLIEEKIKSFDNTLYLSIPDTLGKVSHQEYKHFEFDIQAQRVLENMHCHMSNESNTTFFKSIRSWLETGQFKFNLSDYALPPKEYREKYLITV